MDDELRSLRPLATLDRRGFVTTALAGGFAAATLPVSAETITTSVDGLDAGEARIPVPGGLMPAYYARPARGSKLPIVLVVQEVFVWMSPRWKARLREHPELRAQVELDGFAPDDASSLVGSDLPPAPDVPADRSPDGPASTDNPSQPPTRA